MKICKIPVSTNECEDKRYKHCSDCPHCESCDMSWVSELWINENKLNGKDSLLGPFLPGWVKPDMRSGHIISVTGKLDFCCFNVPKLKDAVTIGDIYVDEKARGQGISKKLIKYLMDTYDRDIFAKCVRGTSAEKFWAHLGTQIDANDGKGPDFYQHRDGKRDLGWYRVINENKTSYKEELF